MQTGELLPELKKRLADSNKNLTTQALMLLARIAKAMGRAIDRQGRPLLVPAIKNITDQKQTVWLISYAERDSVALCLHVHMFTC